MESSHSDDAEATSRDTHTTSYKFRDLEIAAVRDLGGVLILT